LNGFNVYLLKLGRKALFFAFVKVSGLS